MKIRKIKQIFVRNNFENVFRTLEQIIDGVPCTPGLNIKPKSSNQHVYTGVLSYSPLKRMYRG